MLECSVVIPTHNRCDLLRHVLAALRHQTCPAACVEVIVVDDGSTDGTRQMVEALASAGRQAVSVRYMAQDPTKRGPAAANNTGILAASGEILLFLNDDVVADRRLVAAHVAQHRRHPGRVVQGRVKLTATPEDLDRRPRGFREYPARSLAAYFVTWNCSVSRQLLLDVGLFNEMFVAPGWEDTEVGLRIRRRGVRQLHCADALGYHIKPDFRLADLDRLRDKTRASAANALLYSALHPACSVQLSTQAWWLPRAVGRGLGAAVRGVGARRIRNGLAWLEKHGWTRVLALGVWAARYYWYLVGIAHEGPNLACGLTPAAREPGLA